jgi:pilus assembly protein CpaB
MKKIIPIFISLLVFVAAVALVQPEPTAQVVVAARDMAAGHEIQVGEVLLEDIPEHLIPPGSFTFPDEVVGATLILDRAAGDVIRESTLGEPIKLLPNERAVAVRVTDSAGLAGLIQPGDTIGIVAVIQVQDPGGMNGMFSKSTIEPMRVLYISPEFEALDDREVLEPDPVTGLVQKENRDTEGTVLLAVPTDALVVLYDFSGREAPNQSRKVNAIELLTALDAALNATLSLYFVPENPEAFASEGLFLPDLVITPAPTPTNTPTPDGLLLTLTPIVVDATPTPES